MSTGGGCVNTPKSNEEFRASALQHTGAAVWGPDGQECCGKPALLFHADGKKVKGNKLSNVCKQHQMQLTCVEVFKQMILTEAKRKQRLYGMERNLIWGLMVLLPSYLVQERICAQRALRG